jgi:hypothetical protein
VTECATIFEVMVCLGLLAYPLLGKISTYDLQGVEGSWECRTSAGTSGVFISAYTSIIEKAGHQDIPHQSISIRIYSTPSRTRALGISFRA